MCGAAGYPFGAPFAELFGYCCPDIVIISFINCRAKSLSTLAVVKVLVYALSAVAVTISIIFILGGQGLRDLLLAIVGLALGVAAPPLYSKMEADEGPEQV